MASRKEKKSERKLWWMTGIAAPVCILKVNFPSHSSHFPNKTGANFRMHASPEEERRMAVSGRDRKLCTCMRKKTRMRHYGFSYPLMTNGAYSNARHWTSPTRSDVTRHNIVNFTAAAIFCRVTWIDCQSFLVDVIWVILFRKTMSGNECLEFFSIFVVVWEKWERQRGGLGKKWLL